MRVSQRYSLGLARLRRRMSFLLWCGYPGRHAVWRVCPGQVWGGWEEVAGRVRDEVHGWENVAGTVWATVEVRPTNARVDVPVVRGSRSAYASAVLVGGDRGHCQCGTPSLRLSPPGEREAIRGCGWFGNALAMVAVAGLVRATVEVFPDGF
jgi:hypothetical protein